ncbi:anti-sigma factor [Conexibacter woesei]|uniref:anti-sigma factor n=1 Tax=Conexibacter woesei TaxID=191495 RepID=UPI00041E1137|nr:anti-sigma factor [Conexibacter woesei]
MSGARWPLSPAAVALDALEPGQEALAAQLIEQDAAFRAEVARLRGTAATLAGLDAEAWSAEEPPPLRAVDASVARPAQRVAAVPGPRSGRSGRSGRRPRRLIAGGVAAAVVAALVVVAVVAHRGGDDGIPAPPATTLALRPLPGASGRAILKLNGAGTEAELRAAGLRPSGPHDYYEAWLADARGRMVSMGTFSVGPSGRVDVHMPVAVDVTRYALVDVSLEPDDGNLGHSDHSVLRGRL